MSKVAINRIFDNSTYTWQVWKTWTKRFPVDCSVCGAILTITEQALISSPIQPSVYIAHCWRKYGMAIEPLVRHFMSQLEKPGAKDETR